ncbi:MAG: GDP-mannose 4,6 dehydratase, partial [Thermoplasmata archaeon]|nr:GDP-mannose 4,6 dehydratase [Thermoplasmata archaeon]
KKRDLIDVDDAVRAMRQVAEKGTPGEAYNVGSGVARELRWILAILGKHASLDLDIEVEPGRIRKVDEPVHLADIRRLSDLGWSPRIPFEETLLRILDDWRGRVAAPAR